MIHGGPEITSLYRMVPIQLRFMENLHKEGGEGWSSDMGGQGTGSQMFNAPPTARTGPTSSRGTGGIPNTGGSSGGGGLPFIGSSPNAVPVANAGGALPAAGSAVPAAVTGGGTTATGTLSGVVGSAPAITPAAAPGGFWSSFGASDAIGAGTGLVSGYLGYRGAQEQAESARIASDRAENARQESMEALSDTNIFDMSNWLFPGLFAGSSAGPSQGAARAGRGGTRADRVAARTQNPRNVLEALERDPRLAHMLRRGRAGNRPAEPRALGGPVQPGAPYVVGEQGPELMVPDQPGTVVPNPGPPGPPGSGGSGNPVGNPVAPPPVAAPVPPVVTPDNPVAPDAAGGGGVLPPQQGVQGGANLVPNQQTGAQPAGTGATPGLAVARTEGLLQNPGQTSPAYYERQQEQANQGLSTATAAIGGDLSGRGVDPNSGLGQTMQQSAVLDSQRLRSEAARDQSLIEEGLRREDIQAGVSQYLSYLQTLFGLAGLRSGAAAGGAFPQVAPINTYAPLGTGVSTAGYLLSQGMNNRENNQTTIDITHNSDPYNYPHGSM